MSITFEGLDEVLNSIDKIEQLLQENYDLACQQHTTIQNEINNHLTFYLRPKQIIEIEIFKSVF